MARSSPLKRARTRVQRVVEAPLKVLTRNYQSRLGAYLSPDVSIVVSDPALEPVLRLVKSGLKKRHLKSRVPGNHAFKDAITASAGLNSALEAPFVLCLGPLPAGFSKPQGSLQIQVLSTKIPNRQPDWIDSLRDTDFLLSTSQKTLQRLKNLGSFKPGWLVENNTKGIADRILTLIDDINLQNPSEGKPIVHFRGRGRRLIDVYMTTSRRPNFFEKTLAQLIEAKKATDHDIRLHVFVDRLDGETLGILAAHVDELGILSTSYQQGLPFLYNMIVAHQEQSELRSERFADYLCYIQDDCLIKNPGVYFDFMVQAYEEALPIGEIGYVSGYYCTLHPGFELRDFNQKKVLLSDSIDGKNFFAPPSLIRKVGPLSWYSHKGVRRGNPGPGKVGSHFDLWQWKESPRALTKQNRVSVVIPGLCTHIAESKEDSTWGNDTTDERRDERRDEGRLYNTRGVIPDAVDNDF